MGSQYDLFHKTVLFSKPLGDRQEEIKNVYLNNLTRRVIIMNSLILFFHFIFSIVELINGSVKNYDIFQIIGLVLILVSTAGTIFILRFEEDQTGMLTRCVILLNSIIITIAFTLFTYSAYSSALAEGGKNVVEYMGLPSGTALLVLLLVTPLYEKLDSFLLILSIITEYVIMIFLPTGKIMNPGINIVFGIILVVAYMYCRGQILEYATNTVSIKELNEKLSYKAYMDYQTGLLNRQALYAYMDKAKFNRELNKITAIMFDIDDFKKYNDNFGYAKGDELVTKVAKTLVENVSNNFIFRYGTDEFLCIVENKDIEYIKEMATTCKNKIDELNNDVIDNERISMSICCAEITENTVMSNVVELCEKHLKESRCKEKGKISINGEIIG